MPFKFNPFTANFDYYESGGSGAADELPSGTEPGVITGSVPVMILIAATPLLLALIEGIWTVVGGGGSNPLTDLLTESGLQLMTEGGLTIQIE